MEGRREKILGLLKVRVVRGINLVIRDIFVKRSSDPYVILQMGEQKLKTRVIKKNLNPEWNEVLTLSVEDPTLPVRIKVYDKDTFTRDDLMGSAEFYIGPFVEAVMMKGDPNGSIIRRVMPSRENCLAKESDIYMSDGKVFQNILLRLRDGGQGQVELQLEWVGNPGASGL